MSEYMTREEVTAKEKIMTAFVFDAAVKAGKIKKHFNGSKPIYLRSEVLAHRAYLDDRLSVKKPVWNTQYNGYY